MSGHDLIVVHTMVGYLASTDRMFHGGGYSGTESHYGVGGKWGTDAREGLDGAVYQWQDRSHSADANLDANPRAISIETADNAPGAARDIQRWTPKQAAALVDLIAWECSPAAHADCPPSWACHGHGIPARLVPDSRPGRRGIAYHRQGVDPWRVSGGQKWSTSRGKECPGPVRIGQLVEEIIPAVRAKLEGEDDVSETDVTNVLRKSKIVRNLNGPDPDKPVWTVVGALEKNDQKQDNQGKALKTLAAQVKALTASTAAVAAAVEGMSPTEVRAVLQAGLADLREAIKGIDVTVEVKP
jgi:hypothetical protein